MREFLLNTVAYIILDLDNELNRGNLIGENFYHIDCYSI